MEWSGFGGFSRKTSRPALDFINKRHYTMKKYSWEDGHAPQNNFTASIPGGLGNKKIRAGTKPKLAIW
jgi:hypothetical protein